MSDFEYLSSQITPSTAEWTVTVIIALLATIVLVIVFQVHDPFGGSFRGHRSRHMFNRFGSL